jgi:hypothetical protein
MTNGPKGHDFGEAASSRADKPHSGNAYSRAYHGPGHEIVKKPFAPRKAANKRHGLHKARRKDVNCPEIPLARFDGRISRQISRRRIPQLLLTYRSPLVGASAASAIHQKNRGERSLRGRLSDKLTAR